jgi:hypothetical protein
MTSIRGGVRALATSAHSFLKGDTMNENEKTLMTLRHFIYEFVNFLNGVWGLKIFRVMISSCYGKWGLEIEVLDFVALGINFVE